MVKRRANYAHWTIAFLVALSVAACSGGSPTRPAETDPFGGNWDDRSIFAEAVANPADLEGLDGASVYHIDLVIAPDLDVLNGREWIRYTNRETEPLEEIYLQLFPNVTGGHTTISVLRVGGVDVQPALRYADSAVRVPLPEMLSPGETTTVQVDFAVEVGREAEGNYGVFGYLDGVLVLDTFYPVVSVFDDEGWKIRDLHSVGDLTFLDTSFYLVRVSAPSDLDLVASGSEVDRGQAGGNQEVIFAAGPARDFYLAAAPDLEKRSARAGETQINSFGRSSDVEGAEQALQAARDALALFAERIGPYPYDEFDLIGTPLQALGIEYPGVTAISFALYDLESVVANVPAPIMLEGTVAHEVAHQWFYNVVGNDQIGEPWLDEALAQYLTGLYYREMYGVEAEQDYRQSWFSRWERIGSEPIPIGLPTTAYAAEEYSPIVYGRGPLFVAALEDLLGPETFAEFLRDYYETHRWGIATGETFRALAEEHCGCDLAEMYAEWVDAE